MGQAVTPEISDAFDELVQRYIDAVLSRRPDLLAQLYADRIRVFDAWQNWSFEGIGQWRDNLDNWLVSSTEERFAVRFEDVSKQGDQAFGCLSAVVRYTAIDRDGALLRSMQNRLTWVLQRSVARWLIVHEHTSVPISFEDTKGILERD